MTATLSKGQVTNMLARMDFQTFQEIVLEYFDGEEIDFSQYILRDKRTGGMLFSVQKKDYVPKEEITGEPDRYVIGYAANLWEMNAPLDKQKFIQRHIKTYEEYHPIAKNQVDHLSEIRWISEIRYYMIEPVLRRFEEWAEIEAFRVQSAIAKGSPILCELSQMSNSDFESFAIHHFSTNYQENRLYLLIGHYPVSKLYPDYELPNYGYATDFWMRYSGENGDEDIEKHIDDIITLYLHEANLYGDKFIHSISFRKELKTEIYEKLFNLLDELSYWARRRISRRVVITDQTNENTA